MSLLSRISGCGLLDRLLSRLLGNMLSRSKRLSDRVMRRARLM
jgi:hypothetical protein